MEVDRYRAPTDLPAGRRNQRVAGRSRRRFGLLPQGARPTLGPRRGTETCARRPRGDASGMRPPHPRIERRSPRAFASLREACRSPHRRRSTPGHRCPSAGSTGTTKNDCTATSATGHPRSSRQRSTLRSKSTRPWSKHNSPGLHQTQGGSAWRSDAAEIYQSGRACGASD